MRTRFRFPVIPGLALTALLAGCSSTGSTPVPSGENPLRAAIAKSPPEVGAIRKPPEPGDAGSPTGQGVVVHTLRVNRIVAEGLTLEQAERLLATASRPGRDWRTRLAAESGDFTFRQKSWPEVRCAGNAGTVSLENNGKPVCSLRAEIGNPDAHGDLPVSLRIDAALGDPTRARAGNLTMKPGEAVLVADTDGFARPVVAETNPLILRVGPGTDYAVRCLRIELVPPGGSAAEGVPAVAGK